MSRPARAFLWSRAQEGRLIRVMQSVSTGFWLGFLSPSDLDAVDDAYYVGVNGKRAGPIDYSSNEYNKQGLFDWERRAIEAHFPIGGSIAVMAAGGGREVLALRHLSCRVDGWDCQPDFVVAANELLVAEGFEPSVTVAPRNAVPAGADMYDGLVIGWGAYTLIRGRDRRVALLRELRARVETGSPMLLSFFTRGPANVHLRIATAVGNLVRRVLGRERLDLGDYLEPNFVHGFVEDEIADELAAGGFELKSFVAAPYGHAVAVAASASAASTSGAGQA
jgi:hypothetical protein